MRHIANHKGLADCSNLGDARLDRRYEKVCQHMTAGLSGSIPSAHADQHQSKAAYRFFDNPKVTHDKLVAGHLSSLGLRSTGTARGRVLTCQDTTGLVFTGKKGASKLGPLNYKHNRGFYLHNSLMVSTKGVPVGLFKQTCLQRDPSKLGKAGQRRNIPFEEKETYRWLDHFKAVQGYFGGQQGIEVVDVCDREADIFEVLAAYDPQRAPNVHYLIRSKHNRRLDGTEDKTLRDKLGATPWQGSCKVWLTDRQTAKKRKANIRIRYTEARIKLHRPLPGKRGLGGLALWVVEAEEQHPPKGKKAARWVLLTSMPVRNLKDAKQMVRHYAARWAVERFHYILKQGAKVEDMQLEKPQRLENAISTYSVCAVKIMRLNYLARNHPDMPIEEAGISPQEHEALYKYMNQHVSKRIVYDPSKPPGAKEFLCRIAQLGGYIAGKRQANPGLKTTWEGFKKFVTIVDAFAAGKSS